MKTLYILKGLPASGKSTWAKEQIATAPNTYKRINKDDLRAMLDNSTWSKGNEKFVLRVRDMLIWEALMNGNHVISDDTNLAAKHETRLRQLVEDYKKETSEQVRIVVKFFDVPVEECIKRDLSRNRSVGEQVIRSMYKNFIVKEERHIPYMEQDKSLPKAIMCDLDGTLAILHRNPYDASTCETDELNIPVANIVKTYQQLGHKVLLVSGRMDKYQPQTERWLAKHDIHYDALIMRKANDVRKDSLIKEEIFNEHIFGKWQVDFVLDDRRQVVDMWRKIGLLCCQVAPGEF